MDDEVRRKIEELDGNALGGWESGLAAMVTEHAQAFEAALGDYEAGRMSREVLLQGVENTLSILGRRVYHAALDESIGNSGANGGE